MRKNRAVRTLGTILLLVLSSVLLWQGIRIKELETALTAARTQNGYETQAKRDLLALMLAYPGYITGIEMDSDKIYILMPSGNRVLYDDNKQKTYEQKLQNADLQDMLEQAYPLSDITLIPEGSFDPGRIRAYAFLKEVYGGTQSAAAKNQTVVSLGPHRLQFNKNNGAADSLKSAFGELVSLICDNPGLYAHIYPLGGTFNYRVISGTNLLSAHAFGIAIDLKSDARGYWKWATREQGQLVLDSFPREIVCAFEANGFIWGGKWAHFDIFHFEYRPELIIKAMYHSEPGISQPWYAGYLEDGAAAEYIGIIENAFE